MNELTVNFASINFTKGKKNWSTSPGTRNVTVNGTQTIDAIGNASTTDATLSKGLIGTIGWVWIENLDGTYNILIGSDGTLYPLTLKPGEGEWFRWNAAAVHVKASGGTPQYYYAMIED